MTDKWSWVAHEQIKDKDIAEKGRLGRVSSQNHVSELLDESPEVN